MPELFGTNGVRGVANDYLGPELALKLAKSISTFLDGGPLAVGRDTRTSGEMLKDAVLAGILSTGIDAVDLGVLPSPALQRFVSVSDAESGIMVTASHNPAKYNGIKFVDGDGVEYGEDELEKMEDIFFEDDFRTAGWRDVGESRKREFTREYVDGITGLVDRDEVAEAGFTVVVDPGNGAGYGSTPLLLRRLGCRTITLNSNPDGTFPAREPEPLPENLEGLADTVKSVGADLGVAHDGDADRATFVDDQGEPLPGESSLALLMRAELEKRGPGKVVTPVSSGSTVSETVEDAGGEIEWTPVGSTKVARRMLELGDCVGGGEENGGVIFTDWVRCRDGALTAARMLELLAEEGPLSELAATLPGYVTAKRKVACPQDSKPAVMAAVKDDVEALGGEVTAIDGVKVFLDKSWLLVRPSGTEPVIRVFAEAPKEEGAKALASRGVGIVEDALDAIG